MCLLPRWGTGIPHLYLVFTTAVCWEFLMSMMINVGYLVNTFRSWTWRHFWEIHSALQWNGVSHGRCNSLMMWWHVSMSCKTHIKIFEICSALSPCASKCWFSCLTLIKSTFYWAMHEKIDYICLLLWIDVFTYERLSGKI